MRHRDWVCGRGWCRSQEGRCGLQSLVYQADALNDQAETRVTGRFHLLCLALPDEDKMFLNVESMTAPRSSRSTLSRQSQRSAHRRP